MQFKCVNCAWTNTYCLKLFYTPACMLEMLTVLSCDHVGGARQLAADISLSTVLQNPPVCGQNRRQNQVSISSIHTHHYQMQTQCRNMFDYFPLSTMLVTLVFCHPGFCSRTKTGTGTTSRAN